MSAHPRIRQLHRLLAVVFTLVVVIIFIAWTLGYRPACWLCFPWSA